MKTNTLLHLLCILLSCCYTIQAAAQVRFTASPNLAQHLQQKQNTGHTPALYKLAVSDTGLILPMLRAQKIPLLREACNFEYGLLVIKASMEQIRPLLAHSAIVFADLYTPAKEELEVSVFDPSLNRISYVHNKYPAINGNGLFVAVKENRFDSSDIDFTNRHQPSPLAPPAVTGHATIMASLIGGGGNTSLGSRGAAPGVTLSSTSFANLLPDNGQVLQQLGVSVQNHSYGTQIENFYGIEARAYDQQANQQPQLLHVFSSGNAGTATTTLGPYAGIPGVANQTGNFKMAKNLLTVGATDSFGVVAAASSKGPAYDGRIKPELVALGEDGSSGAAALVSGIALLVQQAYKNSLGVLPPAALVKAALLNGADDVHSPGIDHSSGYGAVNAKTSIEQVLNNSFANGTATNGSQTNYTITIPAGTSRLQCTLVWADSAAALNAAKALINDLDLQVIANSNGQVTLPWVLSSFAHIDSLRKLPVRKRDTLNNVEQVSITNPAAGTYTIRVQGSAVASATQPFSVVWHITAANSFEFVYPVRNSHHLSGRQNIIRWQSPLAGTGALAYSLDNGNSWQPISNNVDIARGWLQYTTPDTFCMARLRMTVGPSQFTSDTFSFSKAPQVFTGFSCPNDFMLYWTKQQPTARFNLYRLGNRYMESFTTATDTAAVLTRSSQPALHYAVEPVLANGATGMRSYTYNYTTQGVGCYVKSLLTNLLPNASGQIILELGTVYRLSRIVLQKQKNGQFADIAEAIPTASLVYSFTDAPLFTGTNLYRAKLLLADGTVIYSDPAPLVYFNKAAYLLYPNPVAKGAVLQVLTRSISPGTISIYNSMGGLVVKKAIRNFPELISTDRLGRDVYFYTIHEEGVLVQKGRFIVN